MVNPYPKGTTYHAWYNLASAERQLLLEVCRSLRVDALVAWLAKRVTRN